LNDFRRKIEALIEGLDGIAGLCVRDTRDRLRLAHNDGGLFPAASLIKLPIYFEYLNRVRQGSLDPKRCITLPAPSIVGGCGILKDAPPGTAHALERIATLMVTDSDNTAANILIDILGRERINAAARALGMKDTRLQRKMMDVESLAAGKDNYTTPRDVQAFLEALRRPGAMPPEAGREIMAVLRRQTLNTKLPALLPPAAVVAHKTGELAGVEHDAGLVFNGPDCCLVVVLTRDLARNEDGVTFCRKIGRLVFDAISSA
jgi:beta-lactamase class A